MTNTDHSDRGHTRVSPSGLKNLKECPGFICDPVWNNHPSTVEGTFLHEALDDDKYDHLSEEQLELVQPCLDAIADTKLDASRVSIKTDIYKEPELHVTEGVKGHVDWVMIQGRKAWMKDWKFGKNKVPPAKENLQGWGYALGIFKKFNVQTVNVQFVQPKCNYITSHTFSLTDIPRMQESVRGVIDAVEKVDAGDYSDFDMSSGICRLCIRGDCPLRAADALEVAKKIDDTIVSFDTTALAKPEVMAKACDILPMLEQFIKAVKSRRLEMFAEGQEIPGYRLTSISGGKEIVNEDAVWIDAYRYLDEETIESCQSLDLTALTKAVYDSAPKNKKKTKEEFEQRLFKAGAIKNKPRKNQVKKITK